MLQISPDKLQYAMKMLGYYFGDIDGKLGAMSKASFFKSVTAPGKVSLARQDVLDGAKRHNLEPAMIDTVWSVESSGSGISPTGRSIVLFEGHWFSKMTGSAYDAKYPAISYPKWDKSKYPGSQDARWEQIWQAITLDPDAGIGSASYGAFQILGVNCDKCGYPDPYTFLVFQSHNEGAQLQCFLNFVENTGLIDELRRKDWAGFAKGYNGTSFAVNAYDKRLASAYEKIKRMK